MDTAKQVNPPALMRDDHDLAAWEAQVRLAANQTLADLRQRIATQNDGLLFLQELKFERCGRHPVDDRELHLIEQINQTLTYMVALAAVRKLRTLHPDNTFRLGRATQKGSDIESEDLKIVAEVFAAVDPKNNRKLRKEVRKVAKLSAEKSLSSIQHRMRWPVYSWRPWRILLARDSTTSRFGAALQAVAFRSDLRAPIAVACR
jgi:hypothetical protein